jgi:hypothetical protein
VDIQAGDYTATQRTPYWSWADKPTIPSSVWQPEATPAL